ncbi:MAG: hypothetical protein LUH63_03880 [Parabacteroides sp.]|nr:hypothetical protein [Parabacteroides sp.]
MKLKNLILAFACCALVFTACSDDDDNKVIPSDVPEAVLKALKTNTEILKM